MADTGWLNPTENGLVYADWTDPQYAYDSDDYYASCAGNEVHDYLWIISFPIEREEEG